MAVPCQPSLLRLLHGLTAAVPFLRDALSLGLAQLRRGGLAPMLSMLQLQLQLRPGDGPADWPGQLRRFFGFPSVKSPGGPSD